MSTAPTQPDRFAQLTYTSFDAGPGQGGWQVKETRGDLTREELEELTARVATRLDVGPTVSFPTPDEIARLPRRLVYGPLPAGSTGYWHSVPAGVDASGRPGNVFTHVVLDRGPADRADVRPIDLWRSPDWLAPFNPDQVVAAQLPAVRCPRPAEACTTQAVIEFVLNPEKWRIGVLLGLLDAVAGALSGGAMVVLAVEEREDAARWVAAVSHLTSIGTARRFYFSTLESSQALDRASRAGLHLVCVPRAELGSIPRGAAYVVVDDAETIRTGSLHGEPHTTAHGSQIPVTVWSGLAEVVMQDVTTSAGVLADMNALTDAVQEHDSAPMWPLAVAVLGAGGALQEAQREAAEAALAYHPRGGVPPDLQARIAAGVTAVLGDGPEEAWQYLSRTDRRHWSPSADIVLTVYLDRVVRDHAWLTRPEGVPLPDVTGMPAPDVDHRSVREEVARLRQSALAADGDIPLALAVHCLRLADVLLRAGVYRPTRDAGQDDEPAEAAVAWDEIDTEVQRIVVPTALDHERSAQLCAAVGQVSGITGDFLRSLIASEVGVMRETGSRRLGDRVPGPTVRWLGGSVDVPEAPTVDAALAAVSSYDVLQTEQLAQALVRSPRTAATARTQLVTALERGRLGDDARHLLDDAAALARVAGLGVGEALWLAFRYGTAVPADVYFPIIKSAPDGKALERLCQWVAPRAWGTGLVDGSSAQADDLELLVALRRNASRSWWAARDDTELAHTAQSIYTSAMRATADIAPGRPLTDEVVVAAQAACVVAAVFGRHAGEDPRHELIAARVFAGRHGDDIVRTLARAVRPDNALAFGSLGAPGSPLVELAPTYRFLRQIRVDHHGTTAPALDHVVRDHLASGRDAAALVSLTVSRTQPWLDDRREPSDDLVQAWRKFLDSRVRDLSRTGVFSGSLGRLRRG